MEEYYPNKKKKRIDFLLGFLVSFGLAWVGLGLGWIWLLFGVEMELYEQNPPLESPLMSAISLVVIILLVGTPAYLLIRKHLKGRRYIAIGIISGLFLPFLVVGACTPWIMFFL